MFEDIEKQYEPPKSYDEIVQDKMDELEEKYNRQKEYISSKFSDFVDKILEEEITDHAIDLLREAKEEIENNRQVIKKYQDKYGDINWLI